MWSYNYGQSNELQHHGVKGMKWGRRKAKVNEARASRLYKKQLNKAMADVRKNDEKRYIDAHNKAADEYNAKKFKRDNRKFYDKQFTKHYNSMLLKDIEKNKHYKKAQRIVDRYGGMKFDDLVKKNQKEIDYIKRTLQ